MGQRRCGCTSSQRTVRNGPRGPPVRVAIWPRGTESASSAPRAEPRRPDLGMMVAPARAPRGASPGAPPGLLHPGGPSPGESSPGVAITSCRVKPGCSGRHELSANQCARQPHPSPSRRSGRCRCRFGNPEARPPRRPGLCAGMSSAPTARATRWAVAPGAAGTPRPRPRPGARPTSRWPRSAGRWPGPAPRAGPAARPPDLRATRPRPDGP